MQKVGIASCCALRLLTRFGHTPDTGHDSEPTNEEITEFITQSRKGNNYGFTPIEIIFLNHKQLNAIGRSVFKKLKYRIIPLGLYNGHGNNIYMLTYNKNEEN